MKLSVALVPCLLVMVAFHPAHQANDPLAVPWSTRQGLLKSCIASTQSVGHFAQNVINDYNNCHTAVLRSSRSRQQTLLLTGYVSGMIECGRAAASWQLGSMVGDVMLCVALTITAGK
ncbi:uncharacterized protein LOC113214205 [Frankliniella occidentalis]|uniref:Uncharacterized protein LOC113214205 n=1 Tax=Frankliniella occidentalis TaxID=133901 RepID=A0A6J1TC80_FRAOC|nr:uncharacterized protein LOC113214205 [Frankliniella occidentalis]